MTRSRLLAVFVGVTLTFSACGGSDQSSTKSASGGVDAPAQAAGSVEVPDVDVTSIPSGDTLNLQTMAKGNDTLFWFWAPH